MANKPVKRRFPACPDRLQNVSFSPVRPFVGLCVRAARARAALDGQAVGVAGWSRRLCAVPTGNPSTSKRANLCAVSISAPCVRSSACASAPRAPVPPSTGKPSALPDGRADPRASHHAGSTGARRNRLPLKSKRLKKNVSHSRPLVFFCGMGGRRN